MTAPPLVSRAVGTRLPTAHGVFRMYGYDDGRVEHVALAMGELRATDAGLDEPPLVRVHSECLTGDALGSYRCDCGEQLQAALAAIAREGRGALLYVRGHEGRGIGLVEKLRAYALQDTGVDTVDANLQLGHPADARTYHSAAAILHDLGLTKIRLLSANPAKAEAIAELGVEVVARVPLPVLDRPENETYLGTKRARMGHDELLVADVWAELTAGRTPERAGTRDDAELLDRYGWLVARDAAVVAQLGQSADGFIAARTGDAEFVTGPEDRRHLHRLRALVDAVVVGASTVAVDDPRLTVRDVPGRSPVRVVLDPSGRVPATSGVLTDGAAPTIWCVAPGVEVPEVGRHVDVLRIAAGRERGGADAVLDPAEVLAVLHERGLRKVLVEGGGRTVSRFLEARLLDRLYLTTAPLLIGDGVPGIRFDGADRLSDARTPPVRRWLLGDDVCTEFDLAETTRS